MKIQKIIYLSLIVISFWSCEKTIDFTGNMPEPMLVMNCELMPDSVIKVQLTKTKFFLSSQQEFTTIDSATVTVTINDNAPVTLDNLGGGIYSSASLVGRVNDKVRIDVTAANLPKIYAEETILAPIEIMKIDTTWRRINDPNYSGSGTITIDGVTRGTLYDSTETEIIGEGYFAELRVKIKFKDNPFAKDFYRLDAVQKGYSFTKFYNNGYETDSLMRVESNNSYSIQYDDVVFGDNSQQGGLIDIGGGYGMNNTFSDEMINGKEYAVTFKTSAVKYDYLPGKEPLINPYGKEDLIINFQHYSFCFCFIIKLVINFI